MHLPFPPQAVLSNCYLYGVGVAAADEDAALLLAQVRWGCYIIIIITTTTTTTTIIIIIITIIITTTSTTIIIIITIIITLTRDRKAPP